MRAIRAACLGVALVGLLAATAAAAPILVYANNPAPGDSFTNTGSTNQGQAVGATGWYYNNVRNSGVVGINTNLPRSGNGSASFYSPDGSAKADIEYLASGVNLGGNFLAGGTLGLFADLVSMTYDWYRVGASTNPAVQHPVLRVLLDADGDLSTVADRGGLVFERAYNPSGTTTVPTDQWVTDTINSSTYLWNFGLGLGFAANINTTPYAYDATLAEWQAYFPNAVILGFSSGVGSGWNGAFKGAVDNIGWTMKTPNNTTQTWSYNFEVTRAVPEPATLLLLGLGLVAAGRRLRRQ